jgi:hypothetical protein
MMNYLIWRNAKAPGIAALLPPHGVADSFELNRGVSRSAGWPTDVYSKMNDRFPKDIALADSMDATGVTVISRKLKDFLVAAAVQNVEFLPLKIINHKGKVAADDYSIVNPVGLVDCIDTKASGAKFNALKKDMMLSCKQLVLKTDQIPDGAAVFRPKSMPTIILMQADLTKKLTGAKFSGFLFKEPEKFKGI